MPTPIPIIPGALLTNTLATYFYVPTTDQKLKSVRLTSVRFVNTDSVARTVTLHVVPRGKSASTATTRFKTITIEAAGSIDSSAYFLMNDVLLPGYFIQAAASVGSVVAISMFGEMNP